MSRNNKLISENLRTEIAKELGVYDQVKKDGGSWENVSSKTCGNIVSKAIEIANRAELVVVNGDGDFDNTLSKSPSPLTTTSGTLKKLVAILIMK